MNVPFVGSGEGLLDHGIANKSEAKHRLARSIYAYRKAALDLVQVIKFQETQDETLLQISDPWIFCAKIKVVVVSKALGKLPDNYTVIFIDQRAAVAGTLDLSN